MSRRDPTPHPDADLAAWLRTILRQDPHGQSVEAEPAIDLARTYLRETP